MLVKHAGDLIGQDEVQDLLDNLQKSSPKLVETVIPKILPLNQLTGILKILLASNIFKIPVNWFKGRILGITVSTNFGEDFCKLSSNSWTSSCRMRFKNY